MLKIEKYKEEIKNYDADKDYFECYLAEIATNQEGCNQDQNCSTCLKNSLLKLLEEDKEPFKLTKLEYEYLKEAIKDDYKYIVCDADRSKYFYKDKPFKTYNKWDAYSNGLCGVLDSLFNFVKWKDEEPYSINDILEKCVVIDDE